MVLKFLQEFMEVVFLGITLKLLLVTPSIWTRHTKNQIRVPAQEVRNYSSDHWIVLKFFWRIVLKFL